VLCKDVCIEEGEEEGKGRRGRGKGRGRGRRRGRGRGRGKKKKICIQKENKHSERNYIVFNIYTQIV
jgi:hypothetical protein